MLTLLLAAVLLPLVGALRAAAQVLVAWILGAHPIHVILGIGPALLRRIVFGLPLELRVLPLGGHVQWGSAPHPVPPVGPWPSRFLLAAAGPVSCLVFAASLQFGLHIAFQARTLNGRPVMSRVVETPLGAAVAAGIRPGDVIEAIDGHSIEYFDEVVRLVGHSEGRPLQVTVRRRQPGSDPPVMGVTATLDGREILGPSLDEQWQTVILTVQPDPTAVGYRLGVNPRVARLGASSWPSALGLAFLETTAGLRQLFDPTPVERRISPGPGDIAAPVLHFLATLCLFALVVNLILPAHDIHRLLLLLVELVARRPLSPRAELAWVRVEVLLVLVAIVLFLAWYVVRAVSPV